MNSSFIVCIIIMGKIKLIKNAFNNCTKIYNNKINIKN